MASQTNCFLHCQHSELAASKCADLYPHLQPEDHDMRACRLEERLLELEREHKKIDAFKRELPLCMQLLHEAMEACKEKLSWFRSSSQRQLQGLVSCSVINEDSVVQNNIREQEPITIRTRSGPFYVHSIEGEQARVMQAFGDAFNNWTRVWNTKADRSSNDQVENQCTMSVEGFPWYMQEQATCGPAKLVLDSTKKVGGAFLPYNRLIQPTPRPGAIDPAVLSLKCPDSEITKPPNQLDSSGILEKSWESAQRCDDASARVGLSIPAKRVANANAEQKLRTAVSKEKIDVIMSNGCQSTRKARRTWSPELHRLFVDALQKLGGAQATPKQIRELMNVEGLTNDEVKSHLQKYRLHARRLGTSPTSSSQSIGVVSADRTCVSTESALHSRGAATISYNANMSRQSQSCETSVRQHATGCSTQAHSQLSSCCVKQLTVPSRHCVKQLTLPHSRHSWQGTDVLGEESVGEAAKPENSASKGQQMHETDEMEDHSFNGNQTHSLTEDDMGCDDNENHCTFRQDGLQYRKELRNRAFHNHEDTEDEKAGQ